MIPTWGGASALPLTMELVDSLKVKPDRFSAKWHKHDRIVAILDRVQIPYIKEFYDHGGDSLAEKFNEEDLKRYDRWCLKRLLEWLQQTKPRMYSKVLKECVWC